MTAIHMHIGQGIALESISASNINLNGTGIAVAYIVQAGTTDAITHIRVRYGVRTGTPPTYVVTIEGVDANGKPDGVDKGGGSPTAKTFTPPADVTWNSLVQEFALTNSYTPATKDEWLAITIRYSSGTCDGSNFSSVVRSFTSTSVHTYSTQSLSGGTWTIGNNPANIGWRTASASYGQVIQDDYNTATANTAGHKSGAYFTIPTSMGSTYRISSLKLVGKLGSGTGSVKVGIWNTSDTELQAVTVDSDVSASPTANRQINARFNSPATLSFGTKYRLGLEVISQTVYHYGMKFGSTGDQLTFPFGDVMGHARWNGTTWTEDNTILPMFELELEDIAGGSGGAGAIVIGG